MSDTENPGTDPIDAEPVEQPNSAATDASEPADAADATDTAAYGAGFDQTSPVAASNSVSSAHPTTGAQWPNSTTEPAAYTPAAEHTPEPEYTPEPPYAPTPDYNAAPAYPPAAEHSSATEYPAAAEYVPGQGYTPAASIGDPQTQAYAQPQASGAPASPGGPIYVQAPTPPKLKGNRFAGIMIGLLASIAFAVVYAGASLGVLMIRPDSATPSAAIDSFIVFAQQPVFWGTIIVFFLAFALIVAVVNRGRWAAYVLGGFGVGALVYLGYIAVVALQVGLWEFTAAEAAQFMGAQWLSPVALIAGIAAREVTIWFGAWVAKRGAKVTQRNVDARVEYDRLLDAGPQLTRM